MILSLREAFIALLPYMIVSALLSLGLAALGAFSLGESGEGVYDWLLFADRAMEMLFPVVLVLAIGYYLSQNLGINTLSGSVLAVACFVANSGYLVSGEQGLTINVQGATAYAILLPLATTYLLAYISRMRVFNIFESRFISVFLIKNINLILPFALVFFLVYLLAPPVSGAIGGSVAEFVGSAEPEDAIFAFIKWLLMVHFFWLLGIHGENLANSMMGSGFMQEDMLPGASIQSVVDGFITLGGAGSVWGLVIAIFLVSRDEHLRQIARLSFPFNVFNISEIVVYGIPIVLNPYFAIPFILCPLINFAVSYFVIGAGLIPVEDTLTSWMTPVLFGGYLVGGGSLFTAGFQLILIGLNTLIYIPFVRLHSAENSEQLMFEQLSGKLAVSSELEGQTEKRHLSAQGKRLVAHKKLKRVIDEITEGELMLYYQPKLEAGGRCYGFEALLRLRRPDGSIVGPYFLNDLEEAGFSDTIDWWVIDRVAEDLEVWKKQGFNPEVSINLNPGVLGDENLIGRLIDNFSAFKEQVEIEILEIAYIQNFAEIRKNIDILKQHGIHTAIDDFGTGYSCLSLLYQLNADTIKLDKSILDNVDTEKGVVLYRQLCAMCKKLGFKLVAEGVETEKQVTFVVGAGVDYIQGWVYAPALPRERARDFALDVNSNDGSEAPGVVPHSRSHN